MARLLYITNQPTPYRLPLYRRLFRRLSERGDDMHVHFLGYARSIRAWRLDAGRLDAFPHTIAKPTRGLVTVRVMRAIVRYRPDVVVLAWAMDGVALATLLFARLHGIGVLVVSGETALSAAGSPFAPLRAVFRRPFFRYASRFITYSARATEYLVAAGVPVDRITTGINVVDAAYFANAVDAVRAGSAALPFGEREDAADARCHALVVAYLHAEKGVDRCISMMRSLALHEGPEHGIVLHIVGAGPEEPALRASVRDAGLEGVIRFHGYRQQDELPRYYAAADFVIFPSLVEVFGLVMAEAAAAALPLIASERAGGTADVVEIGVNGFTYDPDDPAALARHVMRLAGDPELRARMGRASRRIAMERLTIEASVGRYLDALARCIERGGGHG